MIAGTRTVVMHSVWVDELTILILDKPRVVLSYEMTSLLVVTDVDLYHLVLIHWLRIRAASFIDCYKLSSNAT